VRLLLGFEFGPQAVGFGDWDDFDKWFGAVRTGAAFKVGSISVLRTHADRPPLSLLNHVHAPFRVAAYSACR
jgi:hypothetical protein